MRGKKHVRLFFENTYVNSEKHVRVFLNCEYWEIVRIFVL